MIPIKDWHYCETPAGAFATPGSITAQWHHSENLTTAAAMLAEAGRFDPKHPRALDRQDFWFRAEFAPPTGGTLDCGMFAGVAEIWWQNQLIAQHRSMFVPLRVPLPAAAGYEPHGELHICVRAAPLKLPPDLPRARWRSNMIDPKEMRAVRQTLLGHMPGWCPRITAIGAITPIGLLAAGPPRWVITALTADFRHGRARLRCVLAPHSSPPSHLECAGTRLDFRPDGNGGVLADGEIPAAERWAPHTHGEPALHALHLVQGDHSEQHGPIGFRHVALDRGADGKGFALLINGQRIFARGVCWTPLDLVTLSASPMAYGEALARARAAGMNMVRVSGTMIYEHQAFFAACDRLGILVWHDFMFANLDYPVGASAFRAEVTAEIHHFLSRTRHHPCLAVLCGGSEVRQQAEMSGGAWPAGETLFSELLPALAAMQRPDAIYLPNSPWGGTPAFLASQGVCHYYGVGAYMRPLEDARRADVRFAAECLAVAHVPAADDLPPALARHPLNAEWKHATPRDLGASWDFDDVRDHYVGLLYDLDPARLRRDDPARYLDLGRAVSCDLAQAVFSEWRRPASHCAGGLIWQLRDLAEGAGWGLWNARGDAKPVWHMLKRTLQPVQLLLTDEGLNGLDFHLINETGGAIDAKLSLRALRGGEMMVASAEQHVPLPARSAQTINSGTLFGRFFDVSYAYRFGPPSHDVTVAELRDASGALLSNACHLPARRLPRADLGLTAQMARAEGQNYRLTVSSRRFAQYVHLICTSHRPDDDWFHLPPGAAHVITLVPQADLYVASPPHVRIAALNDLGSLSVGITDDH